jgi:hypothetical protein
MIADTNPWAVAAKRVAALPRPDPTRNPPVGPDLVADALRVLVWLAGERAVPPHQVRPGPHGTIVFSWRQGSDGFRVEVLAPGRLHWVAESTEGPGPSGRKLDRTAADLLRSLIPMSRRFQPPREPS